MGPLVPVQPFRIHFDGRGEAGLQAQGLVNPRRLQAPDGRLPLQAQAEIGPVFGRWLDPGKRPARPDKRHLRHAGLDDDLPEARRGSDKRIENRSEVRGVRVLRVSEVVGRGQPEVRVTESLHHE